MSVQGQEAEVFTKQHLFHLFLKMPWQSMQNVQAPCTLHVSTFCLPDITGGGKGLGTRLHPAHHRSNCINACQGYTDSIVTPQRQWGDKVFTVLILQTEKIQPHLQICTILRSLAMPLISACTCDFRWLSDVVINNIAYSRMCSIHGGDRWRQKYTWCRQQSPVWDSEH